MKQKIKLKGYKNCLEANQFKNEISYLEKSKLDVGNLRGNHTKFIRNNRLILKLQQRCRSEKR